MRAYKVTSRFLALVSIIFESAAPAQAADLLLEELKDWHPLGTFCNDRYQLHLVLEAESVAEALEMAHDAVSSCLDRLDVAASVRVLGIQEEEAQLARLGGLIGVSSVAKLLNVSQQRASKLTRGEQFPKPYGTVDGRPVWERSEVEKFNRAWVRTPGRPRKEPIVVSG